jgi:hypothetical protein
VVKGVRGGATHFHEYDEGLGIGHIKIEKTGEKFSVNNFNREVDKMLPTWMKDGRGNEIEQFTLKPIGLDPLPDVRPFERSRRNNCDLLPLFDSKPPRSYEKYELLSEIGSHKRSFDPSPSYAPVFEPIQPRFETPNFAAPRMTQAQFERYSPPPMMNEAQATHYGPVDMMTPAQHQMYDAPGLMNEAQAALYGPGPIIKPGY